MHPWKSESAATRGDDDHGRRQCAARIIAAIATGDNRHWSDVMRIGRP
jgi:hypothetical protein